MAGGLESPDFVRWLVGVTKVAAVVLPLAIAAYGFARRPRDLRLVWVGFLTAGFATIAWLIGAQRDAARQREIEALREEIAAATTEKAQQRVITADEHRLMVERLRELHGPSVYVLANSPDEETARYAREIGSILKEAGWSVSPSFGMIFTPVILPGQDRVAEDVVVGVSPEIPSHIVQSFLACLREGGLPVSLGPHWPGTDHPISVLVGPKSATTP